VTAACVDPPLAVGCRSRQAAEHLRQNREALARTQPALGVLLDALPPPDGDWRLGRDGSLTLQQPSGWWQGCSLPLRAARQQLKSMSVTGPVACFLEPRHAAHLQVALDRLSPQQAVLAIVPDPMFLPVQLGAMNFADDIARHRLWIACGSDWAAQMERLFDEQPGLATPTQFVRLVTPDQARLEPLITEAQRVFQAVTQRRSVLAGRLQQAWTSPAPHRRRLCVVAGHQFRLGDDAAVALAEAASIAGDGVAAIDVEDPACASTLAMIRAAADAGALLTADLGRGDLPDLLPRNLPWLTWTTLPRVPAGQAAGPNDLLLITEPAWCREAIAAGWRDEQILTADWPACPARRGEQPLPHPTIAIIADTVTLDPPDRLDEFSSHVLLWNSLRQDLLADPSAAGADGEQYLRDRVRRFGVDDAALDRRLFLQKLIWPATMQSLARRLIAEGVPLRLYGHGWDLIPDLSAVAGGGVRSRSHMAEIAANTSAVVDARPVSWRNSLYGLQAPVIRAAGRTITAVRHDLSLALAGRLPQPSRPPALDLSSLLARLRGRP